MSNPVKAIPDNFRSLTPNLVFQNTTKAIDFYKSVFDAVEVVRMAGPGGTVMHAELRIGDSLMFLNDSMSSTPPSAPVPGASNPMYLHVYVTDVDTVFDRAVKQGSRVDTPVQDMFWGDRYGKLTDPFGQQWGIATHKEDVAPEEMKRRQDALFSKSTSQH